MVVTLGCSLELLFVYLVLSARTYYPDTIQTTTIVRRAAFRRAALESPARPRLRRKCSASSSTQLSAFREDDYPKAYEFASSTIRANMPLPAFERMVKSLYPLIAQSSDVQFGVILDNGDHALVNVTVIGTGARSRSHYQIIHPGSRTQPDWKDFGRRRR